MSSLEFKWLHDFMSLKELGNFSAAAKARHVTQSAFSRRIQALELWVGIPLFDRTSYPVTLTLDGEKFVTYAERMLLLIKETSDDFSSFALKTDNTIRITCLHSFALNLMPRLFHATQDLFGHLNVSLTPSVQGVDNHFNSLMENHTDVLFVYDMPGMRPAFLLEDKVEQMVVYTTRIIPVISPELVVNRLTPIPFLAYSKNTFLSNIVNAIIEKQKPLLKQVFETTLSESLIRMAVNGAGVAWVPSHAVIDELEAGKLTQLFSDDAGFEVPLDVVAYRSKESRRDAVHDFWQGLNVFSDKEINV
ncbi:LysR substrate-binding domain-containing protein [uncultured Endozoicomonas sp.]|uniref:LysR family transcriptional regulator n=1 Tax=uncultured Endozoicomonas sp. TaxID=432652 RepID=UPI0026358A11|nr:LysR substrate-binding domain-containing protein [uncultured Endozoicomonas sp.]